MRALDQDASDGVLDLSHFPGGFVRLDIALNASGGHIEGRVENEAHAPVAGATVLLLPDLNRRSQSHLFRSAISDGNGAFSIAGVTPGEYKLLAWEDVEPDAWQDPEFLNVYESQGVKVDVLENSHENRTIQALPPASQ